MMMLTSTRPVVSAIAKILSAATTLALILTLVLAGRALAAGVPTIIEESALAGPNSVIMRAKIETPEPNTSCRAQYVTDADYGASEYADAVTLPCSPETLVAGTQSAIAEASGLQLATGYHFRFLVEDSSGLAPSAGITFMTFGIEAFEVGLTGSAGEAVTQAGAHPEEYTTSIAFNRGSSADRPSGNLRDVEVELPPGLIGDPAAVAKCTSTEAENWRCPASSQVGEMYVAHVVSKGGEKNETQPLFNVQAPEGVAAEFSARFNGVVNAFIDAHVRTGGDYGIDADSLRITDLAAVTQVVITLWGEPGAAVHDKERACPSTSIGGTRYEEPCAHPEGIRTTPFMSNPTACTGASLAERASADAYQAPGEFTPPSSAAMPATSGCGNVRFSPSISVSPETSSTDSPTGIQVEVKVPQDEEPEGLATADLKDATVSLPAGVAVNPAEAYGLVGCSQEQFDLHGEGPQKCPEAAKIGTIELDTPLVEHVLPGAVYLAQQGNAGPAQGSNPFGSLLALYFAIEDPETGVIVKLAGKVEANPATGQLTATFDENPQLPFESLKVDFFSGERAPLSTPIDCGTYTATSTLEPWSHEVPAGETGTPDASPSGNFQITSLASGAPCGTPPFAPTLTVGTTNNEAAAYSPFTTLIKRVDGEQTLKSVSVTLPKGVAGMVSKVPLCGEAEADVGACPAASQIGNVQVQAGVGTEPLTLPEPGKREDPVYLTGSFEGAPFGLSIVVHPEAGPFNLAKGAGTASEEPVVVRARIEVNPHTGQVTVATPASGLYSTPTIIQGIPVDIQSILVNVDREDFIFNATSCEPLTATGAFGSAEGASSTASSRYQAAECSKLAFKPKFTATTKAKNSRKSGASLTVKVTYPKSGEANLGKVKVELPKDLPAQEATLKYACSEAQFDSNPADCPEGSAIGYATAVTPVLKAPLTGAVYYVSHAAAKFPEIIAVLQGEGVTIDLAGETFISKKGIISSTFASIPDEPVSSFEMTLPEGEHPVLTAQGRDLCNDKLAMPTQLTGQNGAFIEQKTGIKVEGCSSKISFAGHKVKGRNAKVTVYVPTAGKVKVSGKGVNSKTKKAAGRGTVSFELHEKKAGKLHTTVTVTFKPSKGKKQKKKLKLKFKK